MSPMSHVSGCLQKHNEQKLCEAFDHSKDVFLIFSVNMSGHFQGYARMVSTSNSRQVLSAPHMTPHPHHGRHPSITNGTSIMHNHFGFRLFLLL